MPEECRGAFRRIPQWTLKSEVKITSELDLHLIFHISYLHNHHTICFAQTRIFRPVTPLAHT